MRQAHFRDQLGNLVTLPSSPKRIVSLVPSQTELLYNLGLEEETVGITKFCELPAHWSNEKSLVGGTKNFWFDVIEELSPDLILGNKEENYEAGIQHLQEGYPVWLSNIVTLQDALGMIEAVGAMTDRTIEAQRLAADIKKSLVAFEKLPPLRTPYLIWYQPWMGVASNTFIDTMICTSGLKNVLHEQSRYPTLTLTQIAALSPELVLLPSEPFPFREKHRRELAESLPNACLIEVDGKMFSWYGSHLRLAADYFQHIGKELSR